MHKIIICVKLSAVFLLSLYMIPHLKSGLGDGEISSELENIQKQIIGLVILLTKKAANTAAIYCKHNSIECVDAEHVRNGLKYEAMRFFESESLEGDTVDLISTIENWGLEISKDNVDSIVEKIVDDIEHTTAFEDSTYDCRCELCTGVETVQERWDEYHPEDDAKLFLKTHIDLFDSLYREENNITVE